MNRIFEGTNEINRLLVPGMLARRAVKGGLPLIPAARRLQDELLTPTPAELPGDGPLENERRTVAAMKKVSLMVLGTAMQTYGDKLAEQQEVLSGTADIIIDVYAAESAVLRAAQAVQSLHADAAAVFVNDAGGRVEIAARHALAAMTDGDMLRTLLGGIAARDEGHACEHCRAAAADRGCSGRTEGISFLVGPGCKVQRGLRARVGAKVRGTVRRGARVGQAVLLLLGLAACTAREIPYADEIAAWRADKDRFMRESSESPVVSADRAAFPPLLYFPINPEYRIPAALTVAKVDDVLEMQTSTGQRREMQRVGALEFTLKGQPLKLTAFAETTDTRLQRLFVPFHDRTNGSETYPGGRYLDLERTPTGVYDLDFNRAYHPFCLFNSTYDCPVPPRENRLGIPVRAGERLGQTK